MFFINKIEKFLSLLHALQDLKQCIVFLFFLNKKLNEIFINFGSFLCFLYELLEASRGHARRSNLTFIVLAICFNMKLMLCEPTHVMFHSPVYDQLIIYDQGKRKTLGLRDALSFYGYAVTIFFFN